MGRKTSSMVHIVATPLPWYIVGPLLGLTVAGMYAVTNKHLGISGSYVQFADAVRRRSIEPYRLWFLAGLLLGGAVFGVLGGNPQGMGYGLLSRVLSPAGLALVLFGGGVLLGFGARWAGACTSGHGLTGCSTRSPGSMVATATFMASAVGLTFVLHVATEGTL
jgi:uncharacterized protein